MAVQRLADHGVGKVAGRWEGITLGLPVLFDVAPWPLAKGPGVGNKVGSDRNRGVHPGIDGVFMWITLNV